MYPSFFLISESSIEVKHIFTTSEKEFCILVQGLCDFSFTCYDEFSLSTHVENGLNMEYNAQKYHGTLMKT